MVKEKPNSTRMYDQDGYRRRAACICVRNEAENEVKHSTSFFIYKYCRYEMYLTTYEIMSFLVTIWGTDFCLAGTYKYLHREST